MTLPASGAIAISQLNTEMGYASNRNSAIDDAGFLLLRNTSAHPVHLTDYYNKCNRKLTAATLGFIFGFVSGTQGSIVSVTEPAFSANLLRVSNQNDGSNIFTVNFQGNLPQNYFSTIICGITGTTTYTQFSTATDVTFFTYDSGNNWTQWQFQHPSVLSAANGTSYYVIFH